ncbi:MAG: ABC transporter permease [Myxococcales bacterium]|nr:ABC transporter permease [Myxococcales bacterium]
MIRLVARRLGWTIVVIWFVITATFLLTAALPADPAKALLGPHADAEAIERVRAHYCLDRGLAAQYGCWVGHVVQGDLGESYRTHRPISRLLADRIGPTLQLTLAAIFLQLLLGVPLGILAAIRRHRWPDRAATAVTLLAQSAPQFVLGTLLLYVLAYRFGWFPISGYGEPGLDRLHHLVLPAATLASVGIASYALVVRSELGEALAEDYVRTARAKGLPERTVILRHALRNALGPLLTLIGLDLGVLLGGAVVVETIFAWPGLGREVLQSILDGDLPLILGTVLVGAIGIAIANLLVDLAQLWLDPRLRDR